jgi:protease-4
LDLSIREYLSKKIANKEEKLTNTEENILKEEFKLTKIQILIKKIFFLLIILIEIIFFFYIGYRSSNLLDSIVDNENSLTKKEHVSILNLDKQINDKYADTFINNLLKTYNDKNVKAIIIKLRSPGGTPAAAWNISSTLKTLQKENKKSIYIYVDSMAVSGSYMIASQSSKIYANEFAIVGSIGVIMEHLVFEEISKKVGIGQETLTAGKYKKMISSFSYLKKEDKERIQNTILNILYDKFLKVVSEGRHISIKKLKEFAEGKVYIASDPKVKGILIDEIITISNLKKKIIKDNNLNKDINFLEYSKNKNKNILKSLIGTSTIDFNLNINEENLLNNIK